MKILIIGGVAAGTKTAAKLMRENRSYQVKILTKSKDISYAGCGLPYYVGGDIARREQLIVNTPESFSALTGVEVVNQCEVVAVDTKNKKVKAIKDGKEFWESYDKLVIASGAHPFVPEMKGTQLEGVFVMREPDDATTLRDYVKNNNCKTAVIVGAGFIGLEVAENLHKQGVKVTVLDFAEQIMPNAFDREMAEFAQRNLQAHGWNILTKTQILSISGEKRASGVVTNNGELPADLVVLAIGIRPSTGFLHDSGVEMFKGTVITDSKLQTNVKDVYAVGDCAMVSNMQTGKPMWSAMGSTANIAGRALAHVIADDGDVAYGGAIGTGVVKLGDNLNAGRTGMTESVARQLGYNVETVVCVTDDKAHYYPDASYFVTKLVVDKDSHQLLGIQVIGGGAVDKMLDIAVVGIASKMTVEQFNSLDFAYAPPFSTAIHPFVQACYVMQNKLSGKLDSITPLEYLNGKAKGYRVIDVLPMPVIAGATWVNLTRVNGVVDGLDKNEKLLLVCARGKRGYLLQNRLKHYGYTNTKVLEAGITVNELNVFDSNGIVE